MKKRLNFFGQITGTDRAWRHQISCRCSTPCPAATTDPGRGSGSRRSSSKSGSVTVRHVWRGSTMTTSQASHSSQSPNSRSWIATQVLFRRFKNNLLSDMWSFLCKAWMKKNPFLRLISCFWSQLKFFKLVEIIDWSTCRKSCFSSLPEHFCQSQCCVFVIKCKKESVAGHLLKPGHKNT